MHARLSILATAALLFFAGVPAHAAWELEKEGTTCFSTGPSDGEATISVVAFGPQTFLLITANSFPQERRTYPIALSFDDGAARSVNAEGHDRSYGVPLAPWLYDALHDSARLEVSTGRNRYDFALAGIVKAIDDILACSGFGSYSAVSAHVPQPIAGTAWTILDPIVGTNDCAVRRNGDAIDTTLGLNKSGNVVLSGGRSDWAMPAATVEATLGIGDAAPVEIKAGVFTNIVIVTLDKDQIEALRSAKSLKWTFTWGLFAADVTDADKALDALRACQEKRHKTP
ncbi:MAG: hypothetical protein JO261_02675 [Alphaproteobacteria bacterium]|nr:hypothetical protein [Alphaproteobacteria bacterium]